MGELDQPGEERPSEEKAPAEGTSALVPETAVASPTAAPVVVDDGAEFDQSTRLPYIVVGIGASAGGLEAYLDLFRALAPDTGMAFVVIPHLLPDYKSHMAEILSRNTVMPVNEILEGTIPEPDHVHILPPNARVRLEDGRFHLDERTADVPPRPIDFFFRSLAAAQKTRAIGVILSGTDSDGALGMKAIKGEGGIAIVQSPESAKFPEMPRTSISIDHVDRVLPPGQIGTELASLARQFREPGVRRLESGPPQPADEQHFLRILNLLRGVSGVDFRFYKPTTIRRRVARRMLLHSMQNLGDYLAFLQANPKELRDLQEDALINVTRFFRDTEVFDALKTVIFPLIFADRPADQQVRIWVAGCSSGEEVYSIAICLLEYIGSESLEPPIQIFGTDASEQSIHKARVGLFPESITDEVSPERIRRFFVKADKGYHVSKRLRDLCIFARQNLCHDPPFSKMDLISCRNVLIYMGSELQRNILPTFHYALRPDGFLLLGTSETIREFTDLFQLFDRRHKFFLKLGNGNGRSMLNMAPQLFLADLAPTPGVSALENWGEIDLQRAADRVVLSRYGPPGVILNERLEILQFRGHTSPYLEMPQGSVSLQLTRMLRDSIAASVGQAARQAIQHDTPVRVENLHVVEQGKDRRFMVEVLPIHTIAPRARSYLLLFVPEAEHLSRDVPYESIAPGEETTGSENLASRLGQDLAATRLYLQTLLEERDAKNQELVSANEEIQSSNEEMQSTNEELETTKEELQSSNEELQTVNEELHQRNTALQQTSNDLTNLLNSVNLPVLMLSNDLHIRHFTPPAQRLMNLRAPDIGRPFAEMRLNLEVDNLEHLFADVLDTLTSREIEVQDKDGRWYLLRVRPYRTMDNKIDGVVVVLLDIDQLRRSQQDMLGARDFARSVIEGVPLPLAVVDLDLRIRAVNDAFRKLANIAANEDLDRRGLLEVAALAWSLQEPLVNYLEPLRSAPDISRTVGFEYRVQGESGKTLSVSARPLKPDGEVFLLVTIEDISARKEIERLSDVERDRLAGEAASTARELGRTQDELRALAGSLFTSQEEERRRVARELHDDIGQKLAAIEIDCKRTDDQMTPASAKAVEGLANVRAALRDLAEDVRRISHGLHPSAIEDLGLGVALRALVDDFREHSEMIVDFRTSELPKISPMVAIELYRIAQEGLRNVAKHAGNTHVRVSLRPHGAGIRLQIVDAGEGFDVASRRSGLGIISMEERAREMGAKLTLESKPGEGTRLIVDAPVNEERESPKP